MPLETIFIMAGVAFLAGFMDAIAGGGGLITVPALLLAGLDPVTALATNKFQSVIGTASAAIVFVRRGILSLKEGVYIPISVCVVAGALGALAVGMLSKKWLEAVVPILLILVAIYFAFSPKLRDTQARQRMPISLFWITVAPFLAFYDGIFGPGVGSFFMISFVSLCGLGIMQAVGFTKLANFSSNLGALLVFSLHGSVLWLLGFGMAIGAVCGAQCGVWAAIRMGPRLIKPMLILVCVILAVKLLSAPANPLRVFVLSLSFA